MNFRAGFVIITLFASLLMAGANSDSADQLQIFLIRDVAIDKDAITLGDVSLMHGKDEMKAKAQTIGLGMISMPGQKIQIKKETIEARLASNGFNLNGVHVLGADEVCVKRNELSLSVDELIKTAQRFAEKEFVRLGAAKWQIVTKPACVNVNIEPSNILLVPHVEKIISDKINVVIDVVHNKKRLASRRVTFVVKYEVSELVALRDINPGEMITPGNAKIEKVLSSKKIGEESLYGLVTRSKITSGRKITKTMLKNPVPEILIKKGQIAEIKYETKFLYVCSLGEALQDGRAGELIKVASVSMNNRGRVNKNRVVIAKVLEDGTLSAVH